MKQVLVTGGAGFIGSNFIHWLLKQNPDVHIVNLDALTYAGSLENLKDLHDPSRHTFIKGSITDRALVDSIFSEHKIDTVIHFAAESHVDRSILNPGIFVDTNVVGTFTLLEAARRSWLVEKNVPVEQARFHQFPQMKCLERLPLKNRLLKKTRLIRPARLTRLQKPQVITLCGLITSPTVYQ